jgi:hypothetical protein
MDNAEVAMDKFGKLFSECGHLESPEVIKLMEAAGEFVDNPQCDIDTSLIMSSTEAHAACATDASDLCPQSLASGLMTCHTTYCDTCEQVGS